MRQTSQSPSAGGAAVGHRGAALPRSLRATPASRSVAKDGGAQSRRELRGGRNVDGHAELVAQRRHHARLQGHATDERHLADEADALEQVQRAVGE